MQCSVILVLLVLPNCPGRVMLASASANACACACGGGACACGAGACACGGGGEKWQK